MNSSKFSKFDTYNIEISTIIVLQRTMTLRYTYIILYVTIKKLCIDIRVLYFIHNIYVIVYITYIYRF